MPRFFKRTVAAIAVSAAAGVFLALAPAAWAEDDLHADGPIAVKVDDSLRPQVTSIAIGKDDAAPVAAVADSFGGQGEFVADELILSSNDQAAVEELLGRWHGSIVESVDPREHGVDGVPKQYLVHIDPSLASTDTLDRDAAELAPDVGGAQRVSSEQGLQLLAAAARERLHGLQVGVNWVAYPSTIRTRVATEAPGTPNDFTWPNVCSSAPTPFLPGVSCPQNIEVGEAWSDLARAGVLPAGSFTLPDPARPVIAMIDGGFAPTDIDRPRVVNSFSSAPNSVPCSGGSCPFHGTNTTSAAMGMVDNQFGAAGVAGPVANAQLLPFGGNAFTTMSSLVSTIGTARVANMSFGGEVPSWLTWTLAPFNAVTSVVRASGVALVASAGNEERNVDATATNIFGSKFETSDFWPCESAGVICVGGLGLSSRSESLGAVFGFPGAGSNVGTGGLDPNTVDMWAPGVAVQVGLDPSSPGFTTNPNGVQTVTGTSIAAPQVAGLLALIAAANPSLNEPQLETVLLSTAQSAAILPGKRKAFEAMMAAEPAIAAALGGDRPPELRIMKPLSGSHFTRGVIQTNSFAADDLSTPTILWSIDGTPVATGPFPPLELWFFPFGQHRITATAIDSHGWRVPDADGGVLIKTTNTPPTVSITAPVAGSVYWYPPPRLGSQPKGDRICLMGTSSDATNKSGTLLDSQVSWVLDNGTVLGGHNAGIDSAKLGAGTHTIRFVGTDDGGLSASATTTITVNMGYVIHNPGGFTVVC